MKLNYAAAFRARSLSKSLTTSPTRFMSEKPTLPTSPSSKFTWDSLSKASLAGSDFKRYVSYKSGSGRFERNVEQLKNNQENLTTGFKSVMVELELLEKSCCDKVTDHLHGANIDSCGEILPLIVSFLDFCS